MLSTYSLSSLLGLVSSKRRRQVRRTLLLPKVQAIVLHDLYGDSHSVLVGNMTTGPPHLLLAMSSLTICLTKLILPYRRLLLLRRRSKSALARGF